jgi:hypothetical protein
MEDGYQMKINITDTEAQEKYGTTIEKQKRLFVEKFLQEGGYRDIAEVAQDPVAYRRFIDKFNTQQANGVLEFAAQTNFAEEILNKDLRESILPRSKSERINPTKIIDIVDRHELNQRLKDVSVRRARLEVRRFASKERWRQRFEHALRAATNTPQAELNDITEIPQYFEEGTGIAPSVFRGTVYTRYSVLDVLNTVGRAWETTRGAVLTPISWVMPYSDNVRRNIYDSRERRTELHSNRIERLKRLERMLRASNRNLTPGERRVLDEARSFV